MMNIDELDEHIFGDKKMSENKDLTIHVDELKDIIKDAVSEDRKNQDALDAAAAALNESQVGGGTIRLDDNSTSKKVGDSMYGDHDDWISAITDLYDKAKNGSMKEKTVANRDINSLWTQAIHKMKTERVEFGLIACPQCRYPSSISDTNQYCKNCGFDVSDSRRLV